MSSEESIVKKLKESRLREAKIPTENELHNLFKKYGYDFYKIVRQGKHVIFYDIRGKGEYSPDIYYHRDFGSSRPPEFTIGQAGYGTKDLATFEKITKRNLDAINLVKELNKLDIQSMDVPYDNF